MARAAGHPHWRARNKGYPNALRVTIVDSLNDLGAQRMTTQIMDRPDVDPGSRRRWWALAVIVAAQFMVVLDVAIVNVALPSIKTDLDFSQESLQWVITAYAIFFGGVLLLGGRLAD